MLLNNGDGTFAPPSCHAVGDTPRYVAVGDLNGDALLDLAVVVTTDHSVSVLLNNGDGTYAPATQYRVGEGPHSIAVGDLNGDGRLDLATPNLGDYNVSVLMNAGDGMFAPAAHYDVVSATAIAVGDMDGDGPTRSGDRRRRGLGAAQRRRWNIRPDAALRRTRQC